MDIENLMGGPYAGALSLADSVEAYNRVSARRIDDHVIVGTGTYLAIVAHAAFPGSSVRQRSGPNGAEQAILDSIRPFDWTATRYHRVVIGSGDGAFTEAAQAFVSLGLRVEVAAQPGTVSRALAQSVHAVQLLPGLQLATGPAGP